jgi:hypothetical protein
MKMNNLNSYGMKRFRSMVSTFFNNKCLYCGRYLVVEGKLELLKLDHFIPADTLKHEPLNMVAACNLCNIIKSNRFFYSFYEGMKTIQLKIKQKGTIYDPEIRYETMPQLSQGVYAQEEVAKILFRPLPDYRILEDTLYCCPEGAVLASELEAAERWEHLQRVKELFKPSKKKKKLCKSTNEKGYFFSPTGPKMLIDSFVLDSKLPQKRGV